MIKKATAEDVEYAAKLAAQLWPGHSSEELGREFSELVSQKDAQIFLKFEQDRPVGFAQCQLRHDYVEGTASSPVGYLEGIYVEESCRSQGIGRELLKACETWAKEQGCAEFASDCEQDNTGSFRFHMAMEFTEANRIICFTKKL